VDADRQSVDEFPANEKKMVGGFFAFFSPSRHESQVESYLHLNGCGRKNGFQYFHRKRERKKNGKS
jgi:hypothetical protein